MVRGPLRHREPPSAGRPGGAARRVRMGRVGREPAGPGRSRAGGRAARAAATHARALRATAPRVSLDATTALPPVSSDYWELVEEVLTLGTAAAVLAGLRSVTDVLPLVGEMALRDRTGAAADLLAGQVRRRFGPAGYPRLLGGSAADAAVTFLVAPIGPTVVDVEVLTAVDRAQSALSRPAGGLAPGAAWKEDGISWTPETALFAAAWAATGHTSKAEALLRWLGEHRTDAGSFPEKVLHDGRPAAVAPLSWTASLVVIARHEARSPGVRGRSWPSARDTKALWPPLAGRDRSTARTTRETLRFPSWEDVTRGLAASGFSVEESWGDWTGEPVTAGSPNGSSSPGARAPATAEPVDRRPGRSASVRCWRAARRARRGCRVRPWGG